jgi:hypothetical protein
MANDNLTSQTISSTYNQLLITADTGGITGSGSSATQIHCGAATAGAGNADTTALYLSTTRVGIGTATPDTQLEVEDDTNHAWLSVKASAANKVAGIQLNAIETGTTQRIWEMQHIGTYDDSGTDNRMRFIHDGTEYACIGPAGKVGIGTTTPATELNIAGDAKDVEVTIEVHSETAGHTPILDFVRTQATEADPDAVADDDYLALLRFKGLGADAGTLSTGAQIFARVDGTPAALRVPTELMFQTAAGTGDNDVATKMVIKPNGNVGIGTTAPSSILEIKSTGSDTDVIIKCVDDADGTHGSLVFQKADASDQLVHDGDALGAITFQGLDNDSSGVYIPGAHIIARAAATPGDEDMPCDLEFWTNDGVIAPEQRMTIDKDGNVGIGSAASYRLTVGTAANATAFRPHGTNDTYTASICVGSSDAPAANTWWGYSFLSNNDDSADTEWEVDGLGQVFSDTASHGGAADYAEYFETSDGNTIAVGSSVVLVGGKVRIANEGEIPFGVVRPEGATNTGNAQWSRWQGARMTDDYGAKLLTPREWDGESYIMNDRSAVDKEGNSIREPYPSKRKQYTGGVAIINPEWDKDIEYIPRSERDEWQIIGLLGQVPITKGQPIASSWIKMWEVSDSVDMYYIFPCAQVVNDN